MTDDEWMTDGRMDGWMDGRMDWLGGPTGGLDGYKNRRLCRWTGGPMDGWTDGRTDERTGGWVVGWCSGSPIGWLNGRLESIEKFDCSLFNVQ